MAPPSLAQTVTDGVTIKHDGQTYRLWGIDAQEGKQSCADGWEAGKQAARAMADLIRGRHVECFDVTLDCYGRTVALCVADDLNLSAEMVRTDTAEAYTLCGDTAYEPCSRHFHDLAFPGERASV